MVLRCFDGGLQLLLLIPGAIDLGNQDGEEAIE